MTVPSRKAKTKKKKQCCEKGRKKGKLFSVVSCTRICIYIHLSAPTHQVPDVRSEPVDERAHTADQVQMLGFAGSLVD